jgi:ADP-heptose:LPS heptosyltransferase
MPPAALAPLANLSGVHWFSLQKFPTAAETGPLPAGMGLVDYTPELKDFGDTAAFVANLDLVIAVDTAVVHVAGATGRPAWAMLAACPDWRWMMERPDSPWYPTVRLFRQPEAGNWDAVVREIHDALAAKLAVSGS